LNEKVEEKDSVEQEAQQKREEEEMKRKQEQEWVSNIVDTDILGSY
jgi:hypothetical protein